MPIEFDPVNKYILITSPTTEITTQEIYNAAMDWADDPHNMQYDPPMRATGKAPLGGGVYTDSIFILQNGWKIKPWSGNYQLVIKGTLITDDESPRIVNPDSGVVEVVFQVTSSGTISEPVISETEKTEIADKVWTHTTGAQVASDAATAATKSADAWKVLSGRWKIQNNQMIIYDEDGVTPLVTFDLYDIEGKPTTDKPVFERRPK